VLTLSQAAGETRGHKVHFLPSHDSSVARKTVHSAIGSPIAFFATSSSKGHKVFDGY